MKIIWLLICLYLGTGNTLYAQSGADTSKIFEIVEVLPEYPGGQDSMMKFISSNVQYPEEALNAEIQGTVVIQFIIEKDGSISNIKVVRDVGGGLGEEAARVVGMMPAWKPGMQLGEPVRVKIAAPVRFRLTKQGPSKSSKKSRR